MQIYVNTSANIKSRISICEYQIQNKTEERKKKNVLDLPLELNFHY